MKSKGTFLFLYVIFFCNCLAFRCLFNNLIKFLYFEISVRFAFPFLFDSFLIQHNLRIPSSICDGFDQTEDQHGQVYV